MEALKSIIVLVILLIMVKKRLNLGHAFLLAACLFGILHRISVPTMAKIAYSSFLSSSTLIILGSLFLINNMEKIIGYTGIQTRLVSSIKKFTGDPRAAMVILPGLIGLLPSPGGAIFSAPMVKEASHELKILPEQSAVINYYFRHIWEFFLPLYPANIIAAQIIGIPLNQFLLIMLPFLPITVFIGLMLFRHIPTVKEKKEKDQQAEVSARAWSHLREGLIPILAIILMVIVFDFNILLALTITIITMFVYYRIPLLKILGMIKESLKPGLYYMTYASIYLSEVLQQSGSIDQLLSSLLEGGISPLFITLFFPFFIGLFTGITLPGITIALPIVLTLAGSHQILTFSCLAFMSNFIGVMLSPTHLCLLMSVEYFSANLTGTYRYLYLPETVLMFISIAYAYLLL